MQSLKALNHPSEQGRSVPASLPARRAADADAYGAPSREQVAVAARLDDEQGEVGELERARFKGVLLDEYQDTSVAQATMLSRLFSGSDPEHGLGHPVMAVGDPNQAIYGWRGASVSNILNFEYGVLGEGLDNGMALKVCFDHDDGPGLDVIQFQPA